MVVSLCTQGRPPLSFAGPCIGLRVLRNASSPSRCVQCVRSMGVIPSDRRRLAATLWHGVETEDKVEAASVSVNESAIEWTPKRRARRSLPTRRERRLLSENGVQRGRGRSQIRSIAFTLRVAELIHTPPRESQDRPVTPPVWAYIAHVRAAKISLGKRAVIRNRAKRRVRAAAANVLPMHARRGLEYSFTVTPESLTVPFDELVRDVERALREAECYVEELEFKELRRHRKRSARIVEES